VAGAIGIDVLEQPSPLLRSSSLVGLALGEVVFESAHLCPILLAHHGPRLSNR